MGRNLFGPVRGDWGDSDGTGWWGPEPIGDAVHDFDHLFANRDRAVLESR